MRVCVCMCSSLCYLEISFISATLLMTSFFDIIIKNNLFHIFWTPPKYLPLQYEVTTSCRYFCDERTYILKETAIDPSQTSAIIENIQPGSKCLMKLISVYNPASIDPGIVLSAQTLYTSNCMVIKSIVYFHNKF